GRPAAARRSREHRCHGAPRPPTRDGRVHVLLRDDQRLESLAHSERLGLIVTMAERVKSAIVYTTQGDEDQLGRLHCAFHVRRPPPALRARAWRGPPAAPPAAPAAPAPLAPPRAVPPRPAA